MGLGLAIPTRCKPGVKLATGQRRNNRVLNRLWSVVEWVIARVMTWRVLYSGLRWPLRVYGRVLLVFWVAGGTFE